ALGSRVLQIRSVEFAMKYRVPLWVKSSFSEDPGTLVTEEDEAMEEVVVSGIALNRDESRFVVRNVPDKPGVAAKVFGTLAEQGTVVDVIVQTPAQWDGRPDLGFPGGGTVVAPRHAAQGRRGCRRVVHVQVSHIQLEE